MDKTNKIDKTDKTNKIDKTEDDFNIDIEDSKTLNIKKVSVRRQKHLDRQAKKIKHLRTKEERLKETKELNINLNNIKLPHDIPNLIKFKRILKDFEENGTASDGVLPLQGFGYEIVYFFSNNKNRQIGAMFKANEKLK
jgi:predicted GTPase